MTCGWLPGAKLQGTCWWSPVEVILLLCRRDLAGWMTVEDFFKRWMGWVPGSSATNGTLQDLSLWGLDRMIGWLFFDSRESLQMDIQGWQGCCPRLDTFVHVVRLRYKLLYQIYPYRILRTTRTVGLHPELVTASSRGSFRVRCCQSKQYFPLWMCLSLRKSLGGWSYFFGASPSLSQSHAKSKDEEDEEEVENYTNDNPSRSRSQRRHMAAMAFLQLTSRGFQVMNARGKKAFRDPTKASMPHGISSQCSHILCYYHYHHNDSLEVTRQDNNYWKRNLIQPNQKIIIT